MLSNTGTRRTGLLASFAFATISLISPTEGAFLEFSSLSFRGVILLRNGGVLLLSSLRFTLWSLSRGRSLGADNVLA